MGGGQAPTAIATKTLDDYRNQLVNWANGNGYVIKNYSYQLHTTTQIFKTKIDADTFGTPHCHVGGTVSWLDVEDFGSSMTITWTSPKYYRMLIVNQNNECILKSCTAQEWHGSIPTGIRLNKNDFDIHLNQTLIDMQND